MFLRLLLPVRGENTARDGDAQKDKEETNKKKKRRKCSDNPSTYLPNPFPHLLNTPLIIKPLWGKSSRNHPCPLKPNLHEGVRSKSRSKSSSKSKNKSKSKSKSKSKRKRKSRSNSKKKKQAQERAQEMQQEQEQEPEQHREQDPSKVTVEINIPPLIMP